MSETPIKTPNRRRLVLFGTVALALAMGMTDPTTSVSLLDHLRGLAKSGTLNLMVTGHSLGAALTVVATAWLNDQLAKVGPLKFSLWPHTFACPTMWNAAFATMFAQTFPYYAAVNTNDVVPMGWANLDGVLATFPPPGPSLYNTNWWLYHLIELVNAAIPTYTQIIPSNADSFTGTPARGPQRPNGEIGNDASLGTYQLFSAVLRTSL